MKVHPLITKGENLHYVNNDGKNRIYDMEKEMTVVKMIGFCEGNLFKYKVREKNQDEEDLKKIAKNKNYITELEKIPKRFQDLTVRRAFKKLNIEWDYTNE
jgi:hypothetical protein